MQALPAAPAPPPRRQVLVGTALAGVATIMLIGGMLAVWILQRERAIDAEGTWLPQGVTIPEVPTNVMLIGVWALVVFAQWAVYAARRGDKVHTGLALGHRRRDDAGPDQRPGVRLQPDGAADRRVRLRRRCSTPSPARCVALFLIGLVFTAITAFRFLGGRTDDREIVAAHALYWYVLAAVFSAVWLIVYVQ